MAKKQDPKRKNQKKLEVLELLNDEQRKKQRSDDREDVKTQNCFVCDKKLIVDLFLTKSEKQSNKVCN